MAANWANEEAPTATFLKLVVRDADPALQRVVAFTTPAEHVREMTRRCCNLCTVNSRRDKRPSCTKSSVNVIEHRSGHSERSRGRFMTAAKARSIDATTIDVGVGKMRKSRTVSHFMEVSVAVELLRTQHGAEDARRVALRGQRRARRARSLSRFNF